MGFRGDLSIKPPIPVFPDMDRQARYKPQAENDFLPMAEIIGRFCQYRGKR